MPDPNPPASAPPPSDRPTTRPRPAVEALVPALVAKLNASALAELEVREGDWRSALRPPPVASHAPRARPGDAAGERRASRGRPASPPDGRGAGAMSDDGCRRAPARDRHLARRRRVPARRDGRARASGPATGSPWSTCSASPRTSSRPIDGVLLEVLRGAGRGRRVRRGARRARARRRRRARPRRHRRREA